MVFDHFTFYTKDRAVIEALLRACRFTNVDGAFAGQDSPFQGMMMNLNEETAIAFAEACTMPNAVRNVQCRMLGTRNARFSTPDVEISMLYVSTVWTVCVRDYESRETGLALLHAVKAKTLASFRVNVPLGDCERLTGLPIEEVIQKF